MGVVGVLKRPEQWGLFSSHLGFSTLFIKCLFAGEVKRDWVSSERVGQRGAWTESRAFYVLAHLRRRLSQLERASNFLRLFSLFGLFACLNSLPPSLVLLSAFLKYQFQPLSLDCFSFFPSSSEVLSCRLFPLSASPIAYWPSFFSLFSCQSCWRILIASCSMPLHSYALCYWCLNTHKRLLSWAWCQPG